MTVQTGFPTTEGRTLPSSMIERMTLIIDAFDHKPVRLTLQEIVSRTALPRSTTHRILDQLIDLDWINNGTRGYGLGWRVLGKVGRNGFQDDLRRISANFLVELHLRTGMAVYLTVIEGPTSIVLDKVGGCVSRAEGLRVGERVSAHLTTGGRAMLAWRSPEDVDELFMNRFHELENSQGWDLAELHTELSRIRQRDGLTIDRSGLLSEGLSSVACAVRSPDGAVAAICLASDTPTASIEHAAPLLRKAVRRISREFFAESEIYKSSSS